MPTNNYSDNSFDDQAPLDDEQLWDLLSLYVDGEADPEQAAIVEQMLSSDPAYRRDFDFLMASSKTMRMVEEVEPPASLRETVLSKTSHRPTLVGRMRAAWNRATAPTSPNFGRYATVGGAFAVAAIGAVIFWPHQHSGLSTRLTPPPVAARTTPAPTSVVDPRTQTIRLPDYTFPPAPTNSTVASKERGHQKKDAPHAPEMGIATIRTKSVKTTEAARLNANGIITGEKHTPRSYPAPKSNTPHVEQVNNTPGGYPYSKHMDEVVARHETGTIGAAAGSDFGPKVVTYDETPTPTPPMDGGTHTPVATKNNDDGVKSVAVVDTPKPPQRRVAVLPPDVKYSLTAEALRPRQNPRFDNFDRSLADSGQHRDVMTLLKSSF